MPEVNMVKTEYVETDRLADYLAHQHGWERHEYIPYEWEKVTVESGRKVHRVTRYMVVSWKCRG